MHCVRNICLSSFVAGLFFGLLTSAHAQSVPAAQPVPVRHQISGSRFSYQVGNRDTAESLAARFGEPELTMFPEGDGPAPDATVAVDERHVAAAALDDGLVVNVPQRMLYAFADGQLIGAWPVTVGRPDWPTPLGSFRIAALTLNPTWHVPPAIRAEMEEEGIPVEAEVKPGPKNPLGQRWIGLDHGGIGIHATNHPRSIFHFGSHGCIRLEPEAAKQVFEQVHRSEAVEIVYQPVALAALSDGRIFLESDPDPYELGRPDIDAVHAAARAAGIEQSIDWARASRALVMVEGIARRIDRVQDSQLARAPD
jgi:L,D-transpeptidase ErfK/SrfK